MPRGGFLPDFSRETAKIAEFRRTQDGDATATLAILTKLKEAAVAACFGWAESFPAARSAGRAGGTGRGRLEAAEGRLNDPKEI